MKAKITNPQRAVEIFIEKSRPSYANTMTFQVEIYVERNIRNPYARALQEQMGFDYNLEIEIIPGETKLAPKEVLKAWVAEKIIIIIDKEVEEKTESPSPEVESSAPGQRETPQNGTLWEGKIKLNNSVPASPASMEARIWWNGKFYQDDRTVYLTVYHGKRGQSKVVLSVEGIMEEKMARSDCHLAAANKGVFEICRGLLFRKSLE